MASILRVSGSEAVAVYSDRWRPIFDALGALQVSRASRVEFDAASQEWVAYQMPSGAVIARGRVRSEVINAEVDFLNNRLLGGVL